MGILSSYDELEERWIKYPEVISNGLIFSEIKDVGRFLKLFLRDAKKLRNAFKINIFELFINIEIGREALSFVVNVKKDFEDSEFIKAVLKKIKSTKFIYETDKIKIVKLTLIF